QQQKRAPALARHRAQYGVEGREVPHGMDVRRCRQRVVRREVRRLQEQTVKGRDVEHDEREHDQEHTDAEDVFDRVIRMKRDAVERLAVGPEVLVNLDTVGIVRADLVQRHQVQHHQQQQHDRHGGDVQREQPVEGEVGDAVIAADQLRQRRSDAGDGAEQVDDDLPPPERHVAPGQHVAHEGLGHQRQVHQHADHPQELPRPPIRAVEQPAE
ncbi:hypothetical protein B1A_22140, partial [mine drainage metagenome]